METALQLPKSIDPFSASMISGMQNRNENADIEKAKLEQSKASQTAPFQEKLTQERAKYDEGSKQYQKVGEEVYKEGEQNAQWAKENAPKPLNVPDFKREPLDTKEMNSLGAIMMAFALIGGRHNMNPMVTAGNALASAVKGYKDGDDAKFEKDYKTYKLNFDKAVKIHEDEVNQYKDILNANNMSLSAKCRRLELIAAGQGDTKAQMEFASQDITRITKEIDEKEKQLDVVTEKRDNVDKSVMQAVETNLARRDAEKDRLFMHQESLDELKNFHEQEIAKGNYELFTGTDGKAYIFDKKTATWKDGAPPSGMELSKTGAKGVGIGAGNAAIAGTRMTASSTLASEAIRTLSNLPIQTTSPMFGQKAFEGSLYKAPLSALNQKMSNESSQDMATRLVGVARNLASLETGGAATGLVGLADKIQQGIEVPSGAKLWVAFDKLAEMRQIVEMSAVSAQTQSNLNGEQKALIKQNLDKVREAIPFTHDDIDKMRFSKSQMSFYEFAKTKREDNEAINWAHKNIDSTDKNTKSKAEAILKRLESDNGV